MLDTAAMVSRTGLAPATRLAHSSLSVLCLIVADFPYHCNLIAKGSVTWTGRLQSFSKEVPKKLLS